MLASAAPTTIVVPEMATHQRKLATLKLPEIARRRGARARTRRTSGAVKWALRV